MAVPTSYPPELQRLIDAVAEWHRCYAELSYDNTATRLSRQELARAFDSFRAAGSDRPVAEQPKSEEDTRPRVVQLFAHEGMRLMALGEDGSLWQLAEHGEIRNWVRRVAPPGLR